MAEILWKILAWVLSRGPIADYLICRSFRTPYTPIWNLAGDSKYMDRWWLFNPWKADESGVEHPQYPWCPFSIRVHHIQRPDEDRHPHDHPWPFRTIVLLGGYFEQRESGGWLRCRSAGSTAKLGTNEFHRITNVFPPLGAVTLVITGRPRGQWGFKVPSREYIAQREVQ